MVHSMKNTFAEKQHCSYMSVADSEHHCIFLVMVTKMYSDSQYLPQTSLATILPGVLYNKYIHFTACKSAGKWKFCIQNNYMCVMLLSM